LGCWGKPRVQCGKTPFELRTGTYLRSLSRKQQKDEEGKKRGSGRVSAWVSCCGGEGYGGGDQKRGPGTGQAGVDNRKTKGRRNLLKEEAFSVRSPKKDAG